MFQFKSATQLFAFSPTAYSANVFSLEFPHRGNIDLGPQSPQLSETVRFKVSSIQKQSWVFCNACTI